MPGVSRTRINRSSGGPYFRGYVQEKSPEKMLRGRSSSFCRRWVTLCRCDQHRRSPDPAYRELSGDR